MLDRMKILITGAAGQVGRELVELINAASSTSTLDIACNAVGFDSAQLDITSQAQVDATIRREQPDCVINAAAYTAVDRAESESERAYAVNRDGVANLARACREANIPLLHISTDYVFDGDKASAYTEDDAPNPTSVYGASKLAGEQALAALWDKHVILRVSWVFGRYGNNFVKTMLRLGRERNELNVVDDQLGGPTGAQSIARTLIAIATHPQLGSTELDWGLRHFASEPSVTWCGFAKHIFARATALGLLKKLPVVSAISSAQYPTPVKRPANSQLVSNRLWPPSLAHQCHWQQDLDQVLLELPQP